MLKKNQVDGHANRCRRCDSVSCVDCGVSFFGDDYRKHTSCMTEAERYEGKLFKASKKRNPQEEWMDIVTVCVSTAPDSLKSYLRTMSSLDNIPRKEKQFRNFTSNSLNLRGRNEAIVGQIWSLLKSERERRQAAKEGMQQEQKQKKEEEEKKKQMQEDESKKIKSLTNSDDEKVEISPKKETNQKNAIDPKKLKKAMKKALKKAPNRSMKIKELRKVLGDQLGLPKSARKKLKALLLEAPKTSKKNNIKVDGKIITLV